MMRWTLLLAVIFAVLSVCTVHAQTCNQVGGTCIDTSIYKCKGQIRGRCGTSGRSCCVQAAAAAVSRPAKSVCESKGFFCFDRTTHRCAVAMGTETCGSSSQSCCPSTPLKIAAASSCTASRGTCANPSSFSCSTSFRTDLKCDASPGTVSQCCVGTLSRKSATTITVTQFASLTRTGSAKEQMLDVRPGFFGVSDALTRCMKAPVATIGGNVPAQSNYGPACLNFALNSQTSGRFTFYSSVKPSTTDKSGYHTATTAGDVRNVVYSRMGNPSSGKKLSDFGSNSGIYVIYERNAPKRVGLFKGGVGTDWTAKEVQNYRNMGLDVKFWKL